MKRILFIITFIFLFLFSVSKVNALADSKITYEGIGSYFHAKNNGSYFSKFGQMVKYKVAGGEYSGSAAYCIAPSERQNTSVTYTGHVYSESDLLNFVNNSQDSDNKLTDEKLDKIGLYAYYGYSYPGHNTNEYYVATQMLIYRVMENQVFTNKLCSGDCSKINDPTNVANAMREIQSLVDNHFTTVSFNRGNYDFQIGQTKTITDTNGVLQNFQVESCTNCNANISGNDLNITPTNSGNISVTLKKNVNAYSHDLIFYTSSSSQNMVAAGNVDPIMATISGQVSGGSVSITKAGENSAKLSGVKFGVYNSGGIQVCTIITNGEGVGSCDNLATGKYTVKELETITGYILSTQIYEFELSESKTSATLNISNQLIKGNVRFQKTDSDGKPLGNAEFKLYKENGDFVGTYTTQPDGYINIENLSFGRYYFEESKAPDGYIIDSTKIYFNITNNGDTVELNHNNSIIKGNVVLQKMGNNGVPLSGAEFKLYNSNDIEIGKYTTDQDGYIRVNNLIYGQYYFKESKAPEGYLISDDKINFTINENGKTIELTKNNNIIKGSVELKKLGYENALLANAEFKLYKENGDFVGTYTTQADGYIRVSDLIYGRYYFIETRSPEGYLLNEDKIYFNISNNGEIIKLESTNEIIKGYVELYKLDKENNSATPQGDAVLSGAIYGIFDSKNNKVQDLITDANGYAKSDLLIYGKYTVKELDASTGYYKDSDVYSVNIKEHLQTITVTSKEQVKKFKFEMLKVMADERSGVIQAEPNAVFDVILISKNKKMATLTTNNKGKADVILPYGRYNVCQTSGTDGRGLAPCFEININDSDIDRIVNNGPVKARLKVTKIDKDSQEIIPLAGIKFKIKNKDTNEFVCQTTNIVQCVFETNENGILITPQPLDGGNYSLVEEEDQIVNGWVWNEEELEFSIHTNSNFTLDDTFGALITIEFPNTRVSGELTIQKYGEEFILKNKNYSYKKVNLANILFGIYADEDIYFNGKLIYSKNDLVKKVTTNENGIAKADGFYLGKYYLKELENPDKDYVLDTKIYAFSFEFKNQYTPVITYNLELDNHFKKGTLKFYKIDEFNKKPISDTLIEIYTEDNQLVYSGLTDNLGMITLENLKVGRYYLIEKKSRKEYILNQEKLYFEIKEDKEVIKVTMKNTPITGTLKFKKVDSTNQEPLSDTLIEIYNADTNELVYSKITDKDGIIKIKKIRYGRYYIIEKESKTGYVLNNEKIYFDITENNEVIKVTMENTPITGTLKFKKVDSTNQEPLSNTEIEIYNADTNEKIFKGVTDKDGLIILENIRYSHYYIVEKKAIEGYVLSEEKIYFDITKNDEVIEVIMENRPIIGTLEFTKQDIYLKDLLPNTLIEIYNVNIEKLIFSGKTDENGKLVIDNLKYGKYYILEKEAPEGYLLSEEKLYFEIKEDKEVVKVTMKNNPITGTLKFKKVDSINQEPLSDTEIEIYNANTNEKIFKGVTDKDGLITLENIRYGRYYIIETKSKDGYVLNEEKMYFDITKNDEVIEVIMENTPIIGTLEFTKQDISSSETLPNTLIEIYNADTNELIFSGLTDENGKLVIDNLKYGKYYILEKEAPEGYNINEEKMYFEIKSNGEVVKVTMSDEKIKIDVPITGANKSYIVEIGATILMISGIGLIAYARKRR